MSATKSKEPHAKPQSRKVFLNTYSQRLEDFTARHQHSLWFAGMVGLLWLALAVRAWQLGVADLTFDEVATVFVARRPLFEVIRYVMGASREHPPLYYLGMALWMRIAGSSEFAVRYPSVLLGILTVAVGARLGRRWLNARGGWWNGLLLAIAPFSIWASRYGRMYTLVLLLALGIVYAWEHWLRHPTRKNWGVFLALSLAGAATHYYLLLLWAVQGALLLLLPRQTHPIRRAWLLTIGVAGASIFLFIARSPGVRAMLVETGGRFPYWGWRWGELRYLLIELYLNWKAPDPWPAALGALGLTVLGWGLAACHKRERGLLLIAWGVVPLLLLHLVPESLEARYFLIVFPALVLGIAAVFACLPRLLPRLLLAGLIVAGLWPRWPALFSAPDTDFSQRMRLLHIAARPTDALLMNGPWPALLLTYYPPPADLPQYLIPQAAPPGFDAQVDIPRLERIAAEHERLWVSYGAIHWADPDYAVSQWLAEHTYCLHEHAGLAFYSTAPVTPTLVGETLAFGARAQLRSAAVAHMTSDIGDLLHVALTWRGERLDSDIYLTLGLLDAQGYAWQTYSFPMGPLHKRADTLLPHEWIERRGLWLLPGIPPGRYTLALQATGPGITLPPEAENGWLPLQEITLPVAVFPTHPPLPTGEYRLYLPLITRDFSPRTLPLRETLPRWADVNATFNHALRLVGLQPHGLTFMQGYPMGFKVWWEALVAAPDAMLYVRLSGPTEVQLGPFELAPDFYPRSDWQRGNIVQQNVQFTLPEDLPGGRYHVQAQLLTEDGRPYPVAGSRAPLTLLERRHGAAVPLSGEWADIFVIQVEERDRSYHPPLFRQRADVRFGDVLRLRGYHISQKTLRTGESTTLTVYWQTQQRPDRIYAAFHHLKAADGTMIWHEDTWPQAGIYTTQHWLAGEVVAETLEITIPEGTPPGEYTLYVGLYDAATGDRLPANDAQGTALPDGQVLLLTLAVAP